MTIKVHIVHYCIICFLFSINTNIFSQYGDIGFELLSVEEGLTDATIHCITQDSKGFLWIGTEGGLFRYDGYKFKVFQNKPENPYSLSNNNIHALYADSSKDLWIGTYGGGLNNFDLMKEIFTRYMHQTEDITSISDNEIVSIIKDREGYLWIGTYGGGLNKVDLNAKTGSHLTFIRYNHNINNPSSIAGDEVYTICEDKSGVIWIGTNNGLSRYLIGGDNFINYRRNTDNPNSLSNNKIHSIIEDSASELWIGTYGGGLNKLIHDKTDDSIFFLHYKNDPNDPVTINDNNVFTMFEDSKGLLWIGTLSGGLNIFNTKSTSFTNYKYDVNDPSALSSNLIYSIFEDNSGIIWVGPHSGNGIHKFDPLKEQFNNDSYYIQKPVDLSIKNVFPLCEDDSGILWIGTYDGLYRVDCNNGSFIKYINDPNNPTSLSNDRIVTICEDASNKLWIGTLGGGINKFDKEKEKFVSYRYDPNNVRSISNDMVLATYIDPLGLIWIGTYGGGLNIFDPKDESVLHFKHDPEDSTTLSDNRINSIFEDRNGNIWIGTWSGGLNRFDRQTKLFTHYTNDPYDPTSISINYVYSIYEDSAGFLWIGTNNGGLNRFDYNKGVFKSYRMSDGLPSETVYGLLEDDNGHFWLSTKNGLSKFDPITGEVRNYDMKDGLTDNEFNYKSYCKTKSGYFIFGGTNGLNIFHPDSLIDNTHIPPVVITDFQLFNETVPTGFDEKRDRTILNTSIAETDELELKYDENIFSFEFAALDFHAPEKNKYAYIMEGFEENWNYTNADRRFVTYTNLDPGEYTFRVNASNNHGVWNEEGASIKIIILPPWWATTYAYLFYVLLIIGTIYLVWRMQLKRVKIKHEYEMSKFEAEKMHEVDEMKNRFFANLSHEFRTPLTLIFGPAKDIEEKCKDNEAKHSAGIIKRNAGRLYALVNQLLDISKLEAGKMKLEAIEENIIPILKGYVLSFSSLAERKKIKLNFDTAEDSLNVYIDRDKVEKIISNVLSNAFKFTPNEGRIDVKIEKLNNWVEIGITDNGIGIAQDRLDRIFDRFHQVDGSHTRESEGTGIGLSLTKELVELHKGKIEVESEYGKGSTFKILLPLGKDHLKPEEIVEKEVSDEIQVTTEEAEIISEEEKSKARSDIDVLLDTNKPLLLVVEDNTDVRSYIISHLEEDYRIQEAVDGKDGLDQAMKNIPDLIISDVMMPKMDGFELCEKLKTDERTSHIPIIMLTAKATSKDKIEGYETGADDYIMKPFDAEELKARIKNLIEQRRKLQEHFKKEGLLKIDDKEITSIDKKFLQNVIRIINNHLSDRDFTVEMFAEELSMSRRNLDRKLIALSGESPRDIIKRVRLNHASKLLAQKSGNISEIALEVGFSNPAYFSTSFSEQFGLTPSEYKNSQSK